MTRVVIAPDSFKGTASAAEAATVDVLEADLGHFVELTPRSVQPLAASAGAGAAGGTGFGLLALGATMGGGAALVAEAIGLPAALAGADLVITGEGRFDGQSEAGKAPTEVAALARIARVPTALVAGAITTEPRGYAASVALTDLAGSGIAAMADPLRWLEAAGADVARSQVMTRYFPRPTHVSTVLWSLQPGSRARRACAVLRHGVSCEEGWSKLGCQRNRVRCATPPEHE
ncbi:glycerate kinase [Agromyces sp. SYSU K20354]|uniref:glycerate kinase n=1 Tax=Agromyces cavernae TaxID=2898659 RepID=UPI001E475FCC|nr:glycerate kinase [Agromyces cavernae]MCD2443381.1 glycerate kinase [Agromyces cavernae]